MRESDLLHHIRCRSADLTGLAGSFGEIVVGPGDDCAVIREPGGGLLVIGVDQLVEGRHFEAGTAIDLIARKAVARAVSDLAAMGARPAWGMATGLLPAADGEADELFDAMAKWARYFGCPLIGGDIAVGGGIGSENRSTLSLTVTAAGRMDGGATPMLRSGAQAGDDLWLTGPIGASFESGRHLSFEPRVAAGLAAAASGRVHAAIDISDGLGRDAARVGEASGVVLELDVARIPVNPRCKDWREAVSAGEDYELLLVAAPNHNGTPPITTDPPLMGPIGRVVANEGSMPAGAVVVDENGIRIDISEFGWDHA